MTSVTTSDTSHIAETVLVTKYLKIAETSRGRDASQDSKYYRTYVVKVKDPNSDWE